MSLVYALCVYLMIEVIFLQMLALPFRRGKIFESLDLDPKKSNKKRGEILMINEIRLPDPKGKGTVSIEETLNRRRSIRDYKKSSFTLEQVSQFLWAASGKNLYQRTTPSAKATYPLETYLVVGEVEGVEPVT